MEAASYRKSGFSINEILNPDILNTESKYSNNNNSFEKNLRNESELKLNICENFNENYDKYHNDSGTTIKNISEMNLLNDSYYPAHVTYYYHHQQPSFIESPPVLTPTGLLPLYFDKCGNPLNTGYPLTLPNPYTTSSFPPFFLPTSIGNTKRKGGQIRFTIQQTKSLETQFNNNQYLSAHDRKQLANKLNLSDRQVKTWFQNRRAKWRRTNNIIGSESRYHPNQVQNQYSKNMRLDCIENINKDTE